MLHLFFFLFFSEMYQYSFQDGFLQLLVLVISISLVFAQSGRNIMKKHMLWSMLLMLLVHHVLRIQNLHWVGDVQIGEYSSGCLTFFSCGKIIFTI